MQDGALAEKHVDVEDLDGQGARPRQLAGGLEQAMFQGAQSLQGGGIGGGERTDNGAGGDGPKDARLADIGGTENGADFPAARTVNHDPVAPAQPVGRLRGETPQAAAFAVADEVMLRMGVRLHGWRRVPAGPAITMIAPAFHA